MGYTGRATYSYTFMGETVKGYFTAESPVKTVEGVDYYAVSFGVPTGKFTESVQFTCDGGADKTFTVNGLIEAGETQYADNENFKKLFTAVKNYGAEAAAVFYEGAAQSLTYPDTEALIAKYDVEPTTASNKYFKGTNLLLKDKVSVQFYIKADNTNAITKMTFNGRQLSKSEYSVTAVTDPELLKEYNYVITVPVSVIDMAKPFTAALYEGDVKVDEYTASIGRYCKQYINSESEVGMKYANISKALLAYMDQVDICYGD